MLYDDQIAWIVFDCILLIYAFFLIIYAKYFKEKTSLKFKDIIDEKKSLFHQDTQYKFENTLINNEDKNESLI